MTNKPRVYPLGTPLSEEQVAVTFAMTSRNPAPFDEIAQEVSETRAADFNERWVLGYGHNSVAEHAVIHLAIENQSRLAVDELEASRLASYTEKSSRYQVIQKGSYWTPAEALDHPLAVLYHTTMDALFDAYERILVLTLDHLPKQHPQRDDESASAYRLRIRRIATDSVRSILPAATLTNVGITANARTLEHACSKLMSHDLTEHQGLGAMIRDEGRSAAPTLLKYADHNPYLAKPRPQLPGNPASKPAPKPYTTLIDHPQDAERDLVAALLYRSSPSYRAAQLQANQMSDHQVAAIIADSLTGLTDHDAPPREFELIQFLFESTMDYGALREFRRHRMQSPISQPLGIQNGFHTPPIIAEQPKAEHIFHQAIDQSQKLHHALNEVHPLLGQYAVTHAHYQRVLFSVNLRQCYQLLRLRISPHAHYAIREPMLDALREIKSVHPNLVAAIQPRSA